jgi:autotransporter adhesin
MVAAALGLAIATISRAGVGSAQTPLLEVAKGDAAKLMLVNDDAGLVVRGTLDIGVIPAAGPGVRLMWYPRKGAFRAGRVDGGQWDDGNIGVHSVAFGENTTADGPYSTAVGSGTKASGVFATAVGMQSVAGGKSAFAAGEGTQANGNSSAALGYGAKAAGEMAVAMGTATIAGGKQSTAMGSESTASGLISTAMGYGTEAKGDYSTALGYATRASGLSSTAMGVATTASGTGSVAMGTYAHAEGAGSFAFGDRSTIESGEVISTLANQFSARAYGGFLFSTGVNTGCFIPAGEGALNCTSSRLAKEGFEEVDGEAVLTQLANIPIQRWRYRGTTTVHLGPTAEDFHAAFGLGEGSTKIATVDADGIALRAVQALERRTAELREENDALRSEMRERMTALSEENATLRVDLAWLHQLLERGRRGP